MFIRSGTRSLFKCGLLRLLNYGLDVTFQNNFEVILAHSVRMETER
jgi:hypothetical protein